MFHLMDGVVDRVIAELLRALGDRELRRAGACRPNPIDEHVYFLTR